MAKAKAAPKRNQSRATLPAKSSLPVALDQLLSPDDVAAMLSYSKAKVHQMRAAGKLPPPDSPDGTDPRWLVSTMNEWVRTNYGRA